MTWRPPNPASHTERHYRPDTLKASTADLLEQLMIARSERDEMARKAHQAERRRIVLLDEVIRLKQQMAKPRKRKLRDCRQLNLF